MRRIANGVKTLSYREFAKDYQIEYVDRPGHKRPKAVRVYIGPWYSFEQPPEKIRFLRWYYLIGLAVIALSLLVPMFIDCVFTRTWYIQVPGAVAWIPWVFAVGAAWRLWTAKEKVDRQHNAMTGQRMSGATLFLMGFCLISVIGTIYKQTAYTAQTADYVIMGCYVLSSSVGIALFAKRKSLNMVITDPGKTNP